MASGHGNNRGGVRQRGARWLWRFRPREFERPEEALRAEQIWRVLDLIVLEFSRPTEAEVAADGYDGDRPLSPWLERDSRKRDDGIQDASVTIATPAPSIRAAHECGNHSVCWQASPYPSSCPCKGVP
jgi:hypothetical protein